MGVLVLLILTGFNIALFLRPESKSVLSIKTITNSRQVLLQEKLFWERLLTSHPTYFTGWIELTKVEIQLENIEAAKIALIKAREINPNLEEVTMLSEVLKLNK